MNEKEMSIKSIDETIRKAEGIGSLVINTGWKRIEEELKNRIQAKRESYDNCKNWEEVIRIQSEIKTIKLLQSLPNDLIRQADDAQKRLDELNKK